MTRYLVGTIIWGIFFGFFLLMFLILLFSGKKEAIISIGVIGAICALGTLSNLIAYNKASKPKSKTQNTQLNTEGRKNVSSKKNTVIRAIHYEGINEFATDYPCTLEIKDEQFVITRIKPETVITLPLNRIKSFSAMEESRFMLQYHGNAATTSKAKGIGKYYLVVQYDKGMLAFWGTAKAYGQFLDLQANAIPAPAHIEL